MVDGILEGLRWLGLEWDEGPFFQSQRLDRYRAVARNLVEAGKAYPCFCSVETLATKREAAVRAKQAWKYDGVCRLLTPAEVHDKESEGLPRAIRFRVPHERKIEFQDLVFGRIEHNSEAIEDFVLLRSDGMPTYHLGVVVDDLDMRMTHVIRGADHIPNTPKQILLYQALDSPVPDFAHVPLILGADRSRLSKRHGATSVVAYRDQGYLPEAFRNFLALLGWSPGDDKEKMSTQELIQRFSLTGINKSNAVFNLEKLGWLNSQYLSSASAEELLPYVKSGLQNAGIWDEDFEGANREWFLGLIDLWKTRARLLPDFVENSRPFLVNEYEIEPSAKDKFLKDPGLVSLLPELASRIEMLPASTQESLESCLREFAAEKNIKAGLLINAARALLTGKAVAPGIFEVMHALGQKKTTERLRRKF